MAVQLGILRGFSTAIPLGRRKCGVVCEAYQERGDVVEDVDGVAGGLPFVDVFRRGYSLGVVWCWHFEWEGGREVNGGVLLGGVC